METMQTLVGIKLEAPHIYKQLDKQMVRQVVKIA